VDGDSFPMGARYVGPRSASRRVIAVVGRAGWIGRHA